MFNFFYCFCEVFILKIKIFKSSLPLFFGLYMFEFTSIEWPEYKYNLMLASYSVSSKGIQGKMYLLENCLPPSPKKKKYLSKISQWFNCPTNWLLEECLPENCPREIVPFTYFSNKLSPGRFLPKELPPGIILPWE